MSTPTDNFDEQTDLGLRYHALKYGLAPRGMTRDELIAVLRQMRAQSGGVISPVQRLPWWLRR